MWDWIPLNNYYETNFVNNIKKINNDTLLFQFWHKDNHYTSESKFIGRPGSKREDDGLLVTVVHDGEAEQSYILLLDASTLETVGEAYLPGIVPWTFHGIYVEDTV